MERASAHRDYMVNRPTDAAEPDDSSHFKRLVDAGALAYRGTPGSSAGAGSRSATTTGPRAARPQRRRRGRQLLEEAADPGLDAVQTWTNREATLARELPRSLLVLGGGPTGCEMAQVYARFGVPTTIVQSGERLTPTDHPRNSEAVAEGLRATRA